MDKPLWYGIGVSSEWHDAAHGRSGSVNLIFLKLFFNKCHPYIPLFFSTPPGCWFSGRKTDSEILKICSRFWADFETHFYFSDNSKQFRQFAFWLRAVGCRNVSKAFRHLNDTPDRPTLSMFLKNVYCIQRKNSLRDRIPPPMETSNRNRHHGQTTAHNQKQTDRPPPQPRQTTTENGQTTAADVLHGHR